MIRTRWRKVLLDLWGHKSRTVLVIAAVAVGVFAVGFVLSIQDILLRELDRDFTAANVASATIFTEPFDDRLAERIAEMPAVAAAEGRRSVRTRVQIGPDEWRDLILIAIPDFENIQLDRITPLAGARAPGRHEVIVERLAPDFIRAGLGKTLTIELSNGVEKQLTVVGTAHDSRKLGAEITSVAFGYVTLDTLESLGLGDFYTELRFRVAENGMDLAHVQRVTAVVEDQIEDSGREILATDVPTPGEREVEEIVDTLILILSAFGFVILFLSGFLVVNTISALITQQMAQIGVMKLVGARRSQIMAMYIVMVLSYGLVSLVIGIPLAILVAQQVMRRLVEGLMNILPESYAVSFSTIAVQVGVGLLIPLLAALWPVLSGVQVTTYRALNDVGVAAGGYGRGLIDRLFVRVQRALGFQRPTVLSIRNTIRHKGRLLLTLLILIMGTALFISVLSVRASVDLTLANFMRYHQYDVSVSFDRFQRIELLERLARAVPGVAAVESWSVDRVVRIRPDGSESDAIRLYAIPPATDYMLPQADAGRWLAPGDSNAVVVNSDVLAEESDVRLGSEIVLEIGGRESTWRVVGFAPTESKGPTVYVNYAQYAYVTRTVEQANSIRVVTLEHQATYQKEVEARLLDHFDAAGFQVTGTRTTQALQAANELGFDIVVAFLLLMAVLLAAVGGLGLMTTMSINVLERIREIGVLRAIGASNTAVRWIVVVEGIVIGLISWAAGGLISLPISVFMSNQVGLALIGIPLDFTYSTLGAAVWFVAILVLATAASLGPARNASKLTVREVLAYE